MRDSLPTTTSCTSFQINSEPDSWQSVIPIRRWIPWWRINRPEQGTSSEWSTLAAAYLDTEDEGRERDIYRLDQSYSPVGDSSKISYQTRRSWVAWTWLFVLNREREMDMSREQRFTRHVLDRCHGVQCLCRHWFGEGDTGSSNCRWACVDRVTKCSLSQHQKHSNYRQWSTCSVPGSTVPDSDPSLRRRLVSIEDNR